MKGGRRSLQMETSRAEFFNVSSHLVMIYLFTKDKIRQKA